MTKIFTGKGKASIQWEALQDLDDDDDDVDNVDHDGDWLVNDQKTFTGKAKASFQ